MSNENIVTIITGIIETGAISFLICMIIKGLKQKIGNLEQTIDVQNKTIEAMDKRISETEKISDLYKQFVNEYPKAFEMYKTTILKTKDDIILNLTQRVEGQNTEINNLQEKLEKLNPDEQKSFQKITSFLLSEDSKLFYDFIQKMDEQKDNIIYTIIKSNDFDEFIKLNGYQIIIDDKIQEKLFIEPPEIILEKRIRTMSMGIYGMTYAFTFGKDLYLSNNGKMILEEYYKKCKRQ